MKSFTLLLPIVSAAVAGTLAYNEYEQVQLDGSSLQMYPGFDLDFNELRWVQLEGQEPVLMSELEKIELKAQGFKFFDVSETLNLGHRTHLTNARKPTYPTPNKTELVNPILKTLEIDNLKEGLHKFTSFRTRYYRSDTGKQSQEWLIETIRQLTHKYASKSLQELITIEEFPHTWIQSSVIARINGSIPTEDGVVIVGAHQDSTNTWPFLPAPGADDDGSGSMSILEAYRALLVADFRPERAVEFHWYSAEEGGLLGSQAIAQEYERRSVNVLAMSQYDMTAWVKKGTREEVGVIVDYVNPELTELNKQLIDMYLDIPFVETKCGYACSDHASWAKAGYPSVFTIESTFENSNKLIHTANDRYDISDEFSFSHMLEFSKLAVSFAVELGGWRKSD
ncbi:peptidase [Laetiporus sulphureus 93-53]|uniref:Peptide hydrolase n=1 Tax=Laetiporus sulphureus 93-53 TaxID=1314785 RepID=A0A165IF80_9APHY|nr:peptidase [Laetiporus sulphureus 93-53]KZT12990.1 peptidase [Laetiporus sulphureus 93-53]